MTRLISELAVDPLQYDGGEVHWVEEGQGLSPVRRLFIEQLAPFIGDVAGKQVLDLGCGFGWLSNEMAARGAVVTGIDPSAKNLSAAKQRYPDVRFERTDLQSFEPTDKYDLITAVMVLEHFASLGDAFTKARAMLNDEGHLLTITGDFDKFTKPRHGYTVETEELGEGEVATRTDYGERAGVIYDINRTTTRFVDEARTAGFALATHNPIAAPDWLIAEQPKYAVHNGSPLFHLLDFQAEAN